MKRLICCLGLCLLAIAPATAQIITEKGSVSDQINIKLRQLDLLIKILPLILRKEQYPDLLTGIEKARERERQVLQAEDDELAKLNAPITDAVNAAIDKSQYPPESLRKEIGAKVNSMSLRRQIATAEMVEDVFKTAKFDDGQKKAMAGSFMDNIVDPNAKPGSISEDLKVRFYIEQVFLDPLCYDLLKKLATKANGG